MQRLTGRERIMKVINLQEPDTIPTFEGEIDETVREPILPGSSYSDLAEYLDLDAVCYTEFREDKYEVIDEAKGIVRDQWGAIKQFTDVSHCAPAPLRPAIESEKDLDTYVSPDPDMPSRYKTYEEAVKRFKGKKAIIGGVRPFGTIRDSVRGQTELFKDMIRNPDMVDRLNEIVGDYYRRYVKNLIDIGVDIIWDTPDLAMNTGPMFSLKHIERFVLPTLKEIIQYCHSRGVPCLKHCDGNIWAIFDMFVEAGFDGINPIDPVAGMDLGEAKVKYGDKVCLLGNVYHDNDVLRQGTKDEVHEAVKDCIKKAGKGGGYVCMSGTGIHSAVNPENCVEMVKAIREYGKYPLSL